MCNIAGYVGTQQAAPILLEMIRKQEGYAGGFYTGIATLHEGKIHYAKLTGDTDRLISHTNAATLPGTIGIIHSRSNAGGGDEWAHPFLGSCEGTAKIAYVANGAAGCFQQRSAEYTVVAQRLLENGYAFSSRVNIPSERYHALPDGTVAHVSDVMCQLILRNMREGMDEAYAMEKTFCEIPAEVVGLMLSVSSPKEIAYARINMPMFTASCPHGRYLSSSPTALPEDAQTAMLLPACSSGVITAGEYRSKDFSEPPAVVAPLTESVRTDVARTVEAMLSDGGEYPVSLLCRAAKACFEPADCLPRYAAVYEVLYRLQKQGRLRTKIRRVPGAFEGLTAPKAYFSIS